MFCRDFRGDGKSIGLFHILWVNQLKCHEEIGMSREKNQLFIYIGLVLCWFQPFRPSLSIFRWHSEWLQCQTVVCFLSPIQNGYNSLGVTVVFACDKHFSFFSQWKCLLMCSNIANVERPCTNRKINSIRIHEQWAQELNKCDQSRWRMWWLHQRRRRWCWKCEIQMTPTDRKNLHRFRK